MPTHTPNRTSQSPVDDLGSGEPALLLVPGWCGDRTVFTDLAARLGASRRTLCTDVRGHGALRHQTEDFGAAAVVDDLVALLDAGGVRRVVPVALSHAGWMAVELRRRLGPDRVPGIVLVDWMVLGTPPGFTDALAGLQGPAWQDVRGALTEMWTSGLDLPELDAYVASMCGYGQEHWSRAGREIAAGFAEGRTPLGVLAELERPPATLHLYAQPDDDGYLAAQRAFAQAHPWFTVSRLRARSHFPMLEVPDEMAGLIERFTGSLG
jgi:pimeloyl-ACP methyl ester carboxylesterase